MAILLLFDKLSIKTLKTENKQQKRMEKIENLNLVCYEHNVKLISQT